MRYIILLTALQMAAMASFSQTINGIITNEKKEAFANASISLLRQKDSTLLRSTISLSDGTFNLTYTDTIPAFILVSATGYQEQYLPFGHEKTIRISLVAFSKALANVVVSAKKPMIEVKADKVVFNVENSVNAIGNSAFELLRKSPGVLIDNNDNVSLLGTGVAVYIDNKPSPLTGKELASFLRSLQSTDIEAIEIIKNPSAKYDAAGTGGIINIRLKKDKALGTNGSVNAGYGVAIYGKYNGGFSINHRNKKVNVFASHTSYRARNRSYINLYREQNDSIFDQKSINYSSTSGQNTKAGVDYFINPKNTIGFLVSLFTDTWNDANTATTPILYQPTKTASRTLIANNVNTGSKVNANFNFNYRYADTSGRLWNTDVDYGHFYMKQNALQPNVYQTPDGQVQEEKNYQILTARNIDLITGKSDYEQNFKKGRLGLGIKSSYVKTGNDFNFYNSTAGQNTIDNSRSNVFTLTENINAAYINYKKQLNKWELQAGLRAEQTNTRGVLKSAGTQQQQDISRTYLNFFPSFAASYQVNEKNGMNLNYSRRINRPGYQSLNPFESKLDELTYQKGNPFLKPEYTNSLSLTHSYRYTLNTSVGYSRTTDFSAQITDTIEGKRNFIQQRNAGTSQNMYVNISYPFAIAKWWNVYASVTASRMHNKIDLGEGRTSNIAVTSYSIYGQQTITLPGSFTMEVSGFYNSPSIWGGTFLNRAFWGVDAGLQKLLLKGKATIKVSVSDLFKSMQWRGISNFSGLYMDASGGWESQQLKLNCTYRFGRKEIKNQRNRTTGSDEINKRL